MDRASTFADPKLNSLLTQHFVPVARDDWYERRRDDAEGEFFRRLFGAKHVKDPHADAGGTRQGMYCLTADGTLLADGPGGTNADSPYMHYNDNPIRPRAHFWFGPMTMVDFLGCYNLWFDVSPNCSRFCWWPGTCHEFPQYACKLGIQAALNDINNNHPNDYVSLITFSTPKDSAARFVQVARAATGEDYRGLLRDMSLPLT